MRTWLSSAPLTDTTKSAAQPGERDRRRQHGVESASAHQPGGDRAGDDQARQRIERDVGEEAEREQPGGCREPNRRW